MGKILKAKNVVRVSKEGWIIPCSVRCDKSGKRHEKYFGTLPEARNWIEEAKYADKHCDVFVATDTTGARYTKPVLAKDDIRFLTCEDLRAFLQTAKQSHNYNQYALILETGLRRGGFYGRIYGTGQKNVPDSRRIRL